MKLITTFTLFLVSTISFAQTKDLSTLPSYDCSLKKVMAIIGRQTTIASPDSSTGLEAMLADYCSTFGSNCIRKKETALTDSDYAKDILMVGVLSDLKKWPQLKVPITPIANGFIINDKVFKDRSD
ncbi:hypothetical protein, partial [Chitinophaga sp.]|uniref:hypothetical protein n=1 Tax=Chitinophaga sp. TaxID=1869181 RepID=UPI002F930A6A